LVWTGRPSRRGERLRRLYLLISKREGKKQERLQERKKENLERP